MSFRKLFFIVSILIFVTVSTSIAQTLVSDITQLQSALGSASAGSEIILKNGTWTDVSISLYAQGTASSPAILRAETNGQVLFQGNSKIQIGGSYIKLEGIVFQNPSQLEVDGDRIDPIIEFRDGSRRECNNCTVTNIIIDGYNGTESQKDAVFKWIIVYGQYNEISFNSFLNKYGVGSIINDNRSNNDPNYTLIHHNYFAGRTPIGDFNDDNDQDAIRIGNSSTSLSDSYTEIYDNYFNDWSGEIEVISNKSGSNKYYNNTFRDYQGALTLRHGDNCEVYNNYFFAVKNTFTAGIRVIGEDHLIYNNYISGINSRKDGGSLSGGTGGINVTNGRPDTELSGYYQVKNATIVNNTFVDCDYAIRIGTKISSDLSLAPQNIDVSNNIMLNSGTSAFSITTQPSGSSMEGNITQGGSWDLTTGSDNNIQSGSGLLEDDGSFFRVAEASAAIDAGVGSYSFLTTDILGGDRTASFDAGAEEYDGQGMLLPYTDSDVGVSVGFGASPRDDVTGLDYELTSQGISLFPNPVIYDLLSIRSERVLLTEAQIYDLRGELVLTRKATEATKELTINTNGMAKGLYILTIPAVGSTQIIIK